MMVTRRREGRFNEVVGDEPGCCEPIITLIDIVYK